MTPRSFWPAALLVAFVAFAAERAAAERASMASPLSACEEDAPLQLVPEPARLILPCALAEHAFISPGVAGDPSCADAAIYVVTDAGVLLCQIDVSSLAWSSTLQIKRAPQATLSTSSAFSAAGIPTTALVLTPPLILDLVSVVPVTRAQPREGFARPPAVPS